ncbi:MAG: ABC transporter ATP-binding protein, partial [Bacteroidota bacterium]
MDNNKIDLLLLGRVLALAKPYKVVFILAGVLAVVLAPLATLRPYLVKIMVDDYIFKYDIDGLVRVTLILVGV